MTEQAQTFGFYGKVPCVGDFVRRGLSQGFVSDWDSWLQATMRQAEQHLGPEVWRDAYMSAPIWRFALRAGLCGPRAVTGVLMPSVDAVGRRYPLCIAAEVDLPVWSAVTAFGPTLRVIELIALNMLHEDTRIDQLEADLAELAPCTVHAHAPDTVGSVWAADVQDTHFMFSAPAMPGAEATALFDLSAPIWAKPSEQTL